MAGVPAVADAAVQESRERVQSAVKNAGIYYPRRRFMIKLALGWLLQRGAQTAAALARQGRITTQYVPENEAG